MTAPKIDEQIAFIRPFITGIPHGEMFEAILATLQSIKDAGDDVVEQDAVIGLAQHWRDCDYPAPTDVTRALANGVIRILSAYKLACVERDELKVKILKCENDRLCALCGEAIDQARNK